MTEMLSVRIRSGFTADYIKNPIFIHRKLIHFTIKSWDWGHMRIDMKSKLEYYF